MDPREELIKDIKRRVESPGSIGYGFTHYHKDCLFLLAEVDRLSAAVSLARRALTELDKAYTAADESGLVLHGEHEGDSCLACRLDIVTSGIEGLVKELDSISGGAVAKTSDG